MQQENVLQDGRKVYVDERSEDYNNVEDFECAAINVLAIFVIEWVFFFVTSTLRSVDFFPTLGSDCLSTLGSGVGGEEVFFTNGSVGISSALL